MDGSSSQLHILYHLSKGECDALVLEVGQSLINLGLFINWFLCYNLPRTSTTLHSTYLSSQFINPSNPKASYSLFTRRLMEFQFGYTDSGVASQVMSPGHFRGYD